MFMMMMMMMKPNAVRYGSNNNKPSS